MIRHFFMASISVASLMLVGCVSLSSASLTQIPVKRDNKVSAESKKIIFLGLTFDNDYVDKARDDLARKCPNGKVSGILTKDEFIAYFPPFVWARRIEAEGYCEQNSKA